MVGRGMHDDVRVLGPAERGQAEDLLYRWPHDPGVALSTRSVSRVVGVLAGFVYDEARRGGAGDQAAWEVVQETIVGSGLGVFEERLEDLRNEFPGGGEEGG